MRKLCALMVCGLTSVVFAEGPSPAADEQRTVVVRVADGDGAVDEDAVQVIQVDTTMTGEAPGTGGVFFVNAVAEEDDGTAGDGQRKVRVISRVVRAQDANRGWLGVALGELLDEQAAANNVDHGVMVLNVVKGSPADVAGLKENDIIISVNDEPVDAGVAGLARTIGELGPDGEARMGIVRDGIQMNLTAKLSAPTGESVEWRYAPDFSAKERIYTVPHYGKLMPDGNMQFFGPDDLAEMDKLPDMLIELMSPLDTSTQLSIENGKRVLEMITNRDGAVIEIKQDGDGPIVVKRYAEGAEDDAAEQEYATAEALAAADAEAYEIYRQHSRSSVWFGDDGGASKLALRFHPGVTLPLSDDVRLRIEESIRSAHEAMEKANGAFGGQFPEMPHALWLSKKTVRSFKVDPDGQIELTTRKGDSEIVQVYTDEADLQARNPEAYERYADVLTSPDEQ